MTTGPISTYTQAQQAFRPAGPLRLVGDGPAAAQGTAPGLPAAGIGRAPAPDTVDLSGRAPVLPPTPAASAQTGGLVAGRVPGGVSFAPAAGSPGPKAALPFYRHPADLNAAATSINAGRIVDVRA